MEKKRIDYLDMVKGIGIILVVIGHSTLPSDSVITWLASFHMPLFFIVSGMLLWHKKEEEKPMKDLAIRKFKSIMIPYFSFSVIFILVLLYYLFNTEGLITVLDIQKDIVQVFSMGGISVLWFLGALFVSELFFLFIRKKTNHAVTIGIGVLLAGIAVIGKPLFEANFSIDASMLHLWFGSVVKLLFRSSIAYGFLAIGYYTKMFLKERERIHYGEIAVGILCFFLNLYLCFVNGRVDLNFLVFGNSFLYFLDAYLGTMAIVLICKNCKPIRLITYLGVNSLVIMATHMDCQVLMVALRVSLWLNQYVTRAKMYVHYLTVAVLMLLMELVIIYVFNHYFYFLLGKKKPVKKNVRKKIEV